MNRIKSWWSRLSLKGKALTIGIIVVLILAAGASGNSKGTASPTASGVAAATATATATTAPTDAPVVTPTAAPTTVPTPTPVPTKAFATFGDGTFQVGTDIQPGTYRTTSSGCYWARLSGFSGSLSEILANENTSGPWVVTIAATDKGFESSRCGSWTADLSAVTASQTSFEDGLFIVGTDIVAGTYKSTGGETCYWARVSGFGGTLNQILANDNVSGPTIVTIKAGDKGFASHGCGTWTKG